MFLVKHIKLHDVVQTNGDWLDTAQVAGVPYKIEQL